MLQWSLQPVQVAQAARVAPSLCLWGQVVLLLQRFHEVHIRQVSVLQHPATNEARKEDDAQKRSDLIPLGCLRRRKRHEYT
jgi:hypothetical protein